MMKRDKKCKILNFKYGKGCYWAMILDMFIWLNKLNLNSFAEEQYSLYLLRYDIFSVSLFEFQWESVRNDR